MTCDPAAATPADATAPRVPGWLRSRHDLADELDVELYGQPGGSCNTLEDLADRAEQTRLDLVAPGDQAACQAPLPPTIDPAPPNQNAS